MALHQWFLLQVIEWLLKLLVIKESRSILLTYHLNCAFDNNQRWPNSHNLTSWPKISEMFRNNLLKMLENVNIHEEHIMSSIWMSPLHQKKNKGTLMAHTSTFHAKLANHVSIFVPHLDQKVHGYRALANICTIYNV